MHDETPSEILQQLLDACDERNHVAIRLAGQTEIEALRAFLHESAQQYRRAAEDLCATGQIRHGAPTRRAHSAVDADAGDSLEVTDVASDWERAECEALTYFRDAYDTPLPDPIADTVKRHFEAGVNRLERFRKLQSRLG